MDVSLLLYPAVAGMRVYLEQLLDAMLAVGGDHEFVLFYHTRRSWYGTDALDRWQASNVMLSPAPAAVRCIPDAAWWVGYHPPLEYLLRERIDVFHAGDFMWPASRTVPLVATLHDLTPVIHPEFHVMPNRIRHRRQMRWMARHSRRIVAVSRSAACDFQRLFGTDVPVDVVHSGPGISLPEADPDTLPALRRALGMGAAPYMLCVGTVEPRKNGERLVRAFELAFAGQRDVPHLVFAGRPGWRSSGVYAAAAESTLRDRIHFTGEISADALAALYSGATAAVYPSLYEGFGLPIVEAMRLGVPVLTSATSSMPEVAGNAALLVDPLSIDGIANGIRKLHDSPALRATLAAAGSVRAATFSWNSAARGTLAAYQRALGSP